MGKRSCSSESYINHPMKSSSLERHRKAKRNPLEISQNLFFISVIFFYYKTACSIFNLCLILLLFLFSFLFFFFKLHSWKQSIFLDIFLYFVKPPWGYRRSLLTHTGLNLRTIVAMYDRRRPVRDQIATARGFIYYSEHFQPMPVLKFENCYFFRICTDDNWHNSVRFIHVLINCVENRRNTCNSHLSITSSGVKHFEL